MKPSVHPNVYYVCTIYVSQSVRQLSCRAPIALGDRHRDELIYQVAWEEAGEEGKDRYTPIIH